MTVPIEEKRALKALGEIRKIARAAGYMVFIIERNFGYEPDKLGLIRGTDQFEILRIKGTNGITKRGNGISAKRGKTAAE